MENVVTPVSACTGDTSVVFDDEQRGNYPSAHPGSDHGDLGAQPLGNTGDGRLGVVVADEQHENYPSAYPGSYYGDMGAQGITGDTSVVVADVHHENSPSAHRDGAHGGLDAEAQGNPELETNFPDDQRDAMHERPFHRNQQPRNYQVPSDAAVSPISPRDYQRLCQWWHDSHQEAWYKWQPQPLHNVEKLLGNMDYWVDNYGPLWQQAHKTYSDYDRLYRNCSPWRMKYRPPYKVAFSGDWDPPYDQICFEHWWNYGPRHWKLAMDIYTRLIDLKQLYIAEKWYNEYYEPNNRRSSGDNSGAGRTSPPIPQNGSAQNSQLRPSDRKQVNFSPVCEQRQIYYWREDGLKMGSPSSVNTREHVTSKDYMRSQHAATEKYEKSLQLPSPSNSEADIIQLEGAENTAEVVCSVPDPNAEAGSVVDIIARVKEEAIIEESKLETSSPAPPDVPESTSCQTYHAQVNTTILASSCGPSLAPAHIDRATDVIATQGSKTETSSSSQSENLDFTIHQTNGEDVICGIGDLNPWSVSFEDGNSMCPPHGACAKVENAHVEPSDAVKTADVIKNSGKSDQWDSSSYQAHNTPVHPIESVVADVVRSEHSSTDDSAHITCINKMTTYMSSSSPDNREKADSVEGKTAALVSDTNTAEEKVVELVSSKTDIVDNVSVNEMTTCMSTPAKREEADNVGERVTSVKATNIADIQVVEVACGDNTIKPVNTDSTSENTSVNISEVTHATEMASCVPDHVPDSMEHIQSMESKPEPQDVVLQTDVPNTPDVKPHKLEDDQLVVTQSSKVESRHSGQSGNVPVNTEQNAAVLFEDKVSMSESKDTCVCSGNSTDMNNNESIKLDLDGTGQSDLSQDPGTESETDEPATVSSNVFQRWGRSLQRFGHLNPINMLFGGLIHIDVKS